MTTKNCTRCRKDFEPKTSNHKYCSDSCRKATNFDNQPTYSHACIQCHNPFETHRKKDSYCSISCREDSQQEWIFKEGEHAERKTKGTIKDGRLFFASTIYTCSGCKCEFPLEGRKHDPTHCPECARKYQKVYTRSPKGKATRRKNGIKRRDRGAALHYNWTPDHEAFALAYFNGCCAVCNRPLNDLFGDHYTAMDHWIPLSYDGDDNPGTVPTNMVPLCHGLDGCNNRKNSIMPDVWLAREFGKRKAKQIMARITAYFESINNEFGDG